MAVHTYIGARYVPRFMGVYDPTQQYEALDVVDNGSGTSYIARDTVPPGTPLTDTSHWFVYGASSGAIVQLQNDMIQAQNDILAAQGDITQLQGDVSDLDEKVDGNIIIVGNSFVGYGCADDLADCFGNAYKLTPYGGSGFLPYTGHTMTYEDVIDSAIADPAIDNDSITDILFVSAMGDCRAYHADQANFATSLRSVFSSIKGKIATNFTNCKQVKVTLAESRYVPYFTGGGYSDSNFDDLFIVHRVFKEICPEYAFSYIGWSGFNNLFVAGLFEADNYHPNAAGAARISGWIKTAYFGNVDYTLKQYNQLLSANYAAGSTIRVVGTYSPDHCDVQVRNIINTSPGIPVTLQANNGIFDTGVTNSALPAPSVSVDIISPLIRSIGYNQDDTLYWSFQKGTYGCLKAVSINNPTAATVSATSLASPNVTSFGYNII